MATVLVIDDDPQIWRVVARVLSGAGFRVLEASDGRKGVRLFRDHRPEVILTDILMPEQEGLETIRELRREAPGVAIIAMSGEGQTGTMQFLDFATKLGADAALAKPFRAAELIEAVARLLPG